MAQGSRASDYIKKNFWKDQVSPEERNSHNNTKMTSCIHVLVQQLQPHCKKMGVEKTSREWVKWLLNKKYVIVTQNELVCFNDNLLLFVEQPFHLFFISHYGIHFLLQYLVHLQAFSCRKYAWTLVKHNFLKWIVIICWAVAAALQSQMLETLELC